MGATPGIVSILHTNGQDLTFHPHVHSIVRGGGINAVGKWIKEKRANGSFLCPRRAMEKIFKGFFLDHLRKYILDKTLVYSNLEELESVLEMVGQISGMYMPKLRWWSRTDHRIPGTLYARLVPYLLREGGNHCKPDFAY